MSNFTNVPFCSVSDVRNCRCQEMSFVECQTSQTCSFVQCQMSETVVSLCSFRCQEMSFVECQTLETWRLFSGMCWESTVCSVPCVRNMPFIQYILDILQPAVCSVPCVRNMPFVHRQTLAPAVCSISCFRNLQFVKCHVHLCNVRC